jgi:butyrate kinase
MDKLLIINPGSTSTKIAVYEDEKPVFTESIPHSPDETGTFKNITDQYEFRKEVILSTLKKRGIPVDSFTAIIARGGLLPPIEAGAYEINEDMIWMLRNKPVHHHASNLAAIIAHEIAKKQNIPAYIYDGITIDEMEPVLKTTGLPECQRKSMAHYLNLRAAAMRYARENGKNYKDCKLIVVHLGGGISVSLHINGRIIDVISDEDGTFTPERSGRLPVYQLVELMESGKYDAKTLIHKLKNKSGLLAHLGVNDCLKVEQMINGGDAKARLVYEAMALNVAKDIGAEATVVNGDVEAIILTGGIANSEMFTQMVRAHVEFIAPVIIYPGENEMESLALGGLRVMRGEENAKIFKLPKDK